MTETDRSKGYADSVALDDEEAVVRVLYEFVLGLWGVVNNLSRLRPVRWKALPSDDLRIGGGPSPAPSPTRRSSSWHEIWRRWGARSSPAADPG